MKLQFVSRWSLFICSGKIPSLLPVIAVLMVAMTSSTVAQTTFTWNRTNTNTNDWGNSASWTPGGGPPGVNDTARIQNNGTNNFGIDANYTVGNFTFDMGAGNTRIFTMAATDATYRLTVNGTTTISSGTMVMNSTTINTANRILELYTTDLLIDGGHFFLGTTSANGNNVLNVSGTTTIANGSSLNFHRLGSATGNNTMNLGALQVSGTGAFYIDSKRDTGATNSSTPNIAVVTQVTGDGIIGRQVNTQPVASFSGLRISGSVLQSPATFSGTISNEIGNLNVEKQGGNTQIFSGNNTYTGQTTISGGTLLINGTHIQSAVGLGGGSATNGLYLVQSGATLGGSGRIAGNATANNSNMVYVESGGTLAPGSSIGTLTLDGANISGTGSEVLNMASGAEFSFELAGDGLSADRVSFWNYAGATDFLRNDNVINLSLSGPVVAGTYTVVLFDFFSDSGTTVTASGISGGLTLTGATIDSNITSANLLFNTNNISLEYTVIPEPSTWLLLTVGLCAVVFLRRRSSSRV